MRQVGLIAFGFRSQDNQKADALRLHPENPASVNQQPQALLNLRSPEPGSMRTQPWRRVPSEPPSRLSGPIGRHASARAAAGEASPWATSLIAREQRVGLACLAGVPGRSSTHTLPGPSKSVGKVWGGPCSASTNQVFCLVKAPPTGLEPVTVRLTVGCSAN